MDHSNLNTKIEDALTSFDGAAKATPAPYLLTRIHARLNAAQDKNFWIRAGAFISRPLIASSLIIIFIMLNLIAITSFSKTNTSAVAQNTSSTNYDFAINVSSIYDIENSEP